MQDASLQEIGNEFGCDKFTVHNYADVYERYLGPLRHQPIKLLEIGIGGENRELGGASLKTWERYFTRADIVGIDVYEKSALDTDRIKTLVVDQSDQEALERLWEESGPFDVIIDDGSHKSGDILLSLFKLFHLLQPGGIYIIEDIQTGYWPHYGGTSVNPDLSDTSITWIKRMVDSINRNEILWPNHPAIRSGFIASELHVHRNVAVIIRGDSPPKSNVLTEEIRREWLKRDFEVQGLTESAASKLSNNSAYRNTLATKGAAKSENSQPETLPTPLPKTDSERTKNANVAQQLFTRPTPNEKQRTYIIVGNGRGGTSMVAGVVAALGLPITPHGESLNFEDAEIIYAAQGRDAAGRKIETSRKVHLENLSGIISQRNETFDVWGWKDPSADLYLEDVISQLRNPHIICVWRDLTAVAGSHLALEDTSPLAAFEHSFERYERYWRLLRKLQCPTLMISYERGRQRPADMARAIAAFTGLDYDTNVERRVLNFVSPSGGYRSLGD